MKHRQGRYIPVEDLIPGRITWGVLDTKTDKLVEACGECEKYPEQWAKQRANQLNKKD